MNVFKPALACLLLAASCAASAETRLTLKSDAGDYIGAGKNYLYTDANATFRYSKNYDNGITLNISSGNGSVWWTLDLAAPGNAQLQPGSYEAATRFPFQATSEPGLNFSGSGRGCNTLTGRFDIFEVSYDSQGVVNGINASFEQHCEGATPALRGQLSYNLVPPMGVSTVGVTPISYTCLNRTSGQRLVRKSTATLFDCKQAGLQVNPGDQVTISITGSAE
ncbi:MULTISPECIES: hypothetical protein [unclassified Pseudomonas]|uniref:hypothetical protein n=1 Tax=unclassified Pseudomonas TaxID=196821 RepID=UPI00244A0C5D|nr:MULTISPECIES: hypothetical protein [unclassified Pseudomonas]MDG9925630.1 hypothetical protein [Pseudomonas sp. GD04045]MDH0037581.1 hypothetical protein [Pseudomonas sp. GD04019]